mgnify:CR=1 FL=1
MKDAFKEGYDNKLKSMLFGLLREYEKDRDWEEFLDSILIQLMGYPEEERGINYYPIFYKISSLRYLRHKYFRKTIFDTMSLIGKEDNE